MTEAIAYDMEYAIADWAVAQAAQKLGKQEDYEYFLKRSKSYKNYFDASTGFMRGKMLDGSWRTPFSLMHLLIEKMIIVKEMHGSTHAGTSRCRRTGGMLR